MIYKFVCKSIYEITCRLDENIVDKSAFRSNLQYGNHKFIRDLIKMLETMFCCHSEDFDTNPSLVNVKNGTIDLASKELRKHSPEDKITKLINIKYDSNAIGKRYDKFISEICDDDSELAAYLQILYGYALTGETCEQKFYMEQGTGSNGKSTLNDVIDTVTGDYAERVDFTLFQKSRYASANSPTPELAKLKGKHIVFCSETGEDILNEAKLKEITGGTKITARALYGHSFSYSPEFTIIFDGNNLPTIKGTDNGIWRRIVIIPFKRTFDKDSTLKSALLAEKEAILKWLIDGAFTYYESGFPKCTAVTKATKEYRDEENTVEAFLKYATKKNCNSKCSAQQLYAAYEQYCSNCGGSPVSIKSFTSAMKMNEYKRKRTSKGVFWIGICLNDV